MRGNFHVRCETGEKVEMLLLTASEPYLLLWVALEAIKSNIQEILDVGMDGYLGATG